MQQAISCQYLHEFLFRRSVSLRLFKNHSKTDKINVLPNNFTSRYKRPCGSYFHFYNVRIKCTKINGDN